ncbi:MAG: hypothetical protein ACK2U9_14905 [Anaerolineae bacterium]
MTDKPLILVGASTGFLSTSGGFFDPTSLQDRFTALPMVITSWAKKPANQGWDEVTGAAVVVLLVIVLLANTAAILLRNRYEKKRQ